MHRRLLGLSLLLALLASAPVARAMDTRIPALGQEQRAEDKVLGFRRAVQGEPALLAALDAAKDVDPRDQIHMALLADPAYAAAFARYERTGDNADDWRALLDKLPKDARYARAHAVYFLGRALIAKDDLESAVLCLETARGRLRAGLTWTDEATLHLAALYARLPERVGGSNRARARALVEDLQPTDPKRRGLYGDSPERIREGAIWLQRELRGEGSGPLLELAKRMETIERLIDRTETDDGTRDRQTQVVSELDRLIALMREKESEGGGGGGGGGGGNKPGRGGKAGGNRQSGGPANQSQLPNGGDNGPGNLAEGPRGNTSDSWGNLPPKEREEAEQFMRERFPTRYREIIERYYRALAEEDR